MRDVVIVGGGLFGSIAARTLRHAGMDVELIDDNRPRSGSRAAGCLMKPSWLSAMGRDNVTRSMKLLDGLYGLKLVELNAGPVKVACDWINPDMILSEPRRIGKVFKVGPGYASVLFDGDHQLEGIEARNVIVATGHWVPELVKDTQVIGKVGMSVRLTAPPDDNRIQVWAPYKQLVRFRAPGGFCWAGDGSAIITANWDRERWRQVRNRIVAFAGDGELREGVRPYVKTANPADLRRVLPEAPHGPSLWTLTGGGKNGTAAAGWAASELLRRLS